MQRPNTLRKRFRLICLVVALVVSLISSTTTQAQSDSGESSAQIQAIIDGVNQARINAGLPPLRVHSLLNQAAQAHVDDLIANGIYGHYGSDGSNVHTRVRRTGYPSGWVSENWVTSPTPERAMNWWMNDWIHRVNILNPNWDEFGVGAAAVGNGFWIYVTDFANSDGQSSSYTATAAAPVVRTETAQRLTVPAGGMDYTIRAGDTLLGIAIRYGLDWQDIALANKLGEDDLLQIGQVLRLPGVAGVGGPVSASGGMKYTVQSGDTLIGIAARYGIRWQEIAAANRLSEYSVLQIGMQLRLPGVEESGAVSSGDASASAAGISAEHISSSETPEGAAQTDESLSAAVGIAQVSTATQYTVKPGDTLFSIASRNGLTWEQLAEYNQISESTYLQIGQNLAIPTNAATTTSVSPIPSSTTSLRTYTVRSGDTIVGIAARFGLDWQELLRINGLTESSILSLGQTIRLE